ncbi:MAG: DEAD/DEAH box helicase [Gemmatimonadaceae bacterium]
MPAPPHSSAFPTLTYRAGLAILRGVAPADAPPWLHPDPRLDALVAVGARYPELRAWAAEHHIAESSANATTFDAPLLDPRVPRPAQAEAVARWLAADRRGTVVLPTGAGKTLVALLAIHQTGLNACILVPTRALVAQWFTQLADAFGAEHVGAFYGDEKEVRALTVTTYHSAFTLLERHGERFSLLVCDEVHHLGDTATGEARTWLDALLIAPAAARLGLTATYPDGQDTSLVRALGPMIYRRTIGEMTDAELARFVVECVYVDLTPAERARYDAASTQFDGYAERSGWREKGATPDDAWKRFAASARRIPEARRALFAFRERERVVRLAERKFEVTERVLRMFPHEQAVLFCGGTDVAMEVSRRLAIPLIGAATPASERHAILAAMREGTLRAVASVRVLDEGWDVPGAKLGIVLGDSTRGGKRQHTQRLGRLLRRQGDQVATLYEIVAAGTWEFFASKRRGAAVRRVSEGQLGLGL